MGTRLKKIKFFIFNITKKFKLENHLGQVIIVSIGSKFTIIILYLFILVPLRHKDSMRRLELVIWIGELCKICLSIHPTIIIDGNMAFLANAQNIIICCVP